MNQHGDALNRLPLYWKDGSSDEHRQRAPTWRYSALVSRSVTWTCSRNYSASLKLRSSWRDAAGGDFQVLQVLQVFQESCIPRAKAWTRFTGNLIEYATSPDYWETCRVSVVKLNLWFWLTTVMAGVIWEGAGGEDMPPTPPLAFTALIDLIKHKLIQDHLVVCM